MSELPTPEELRQIRPARVYAGGYDRGQTDALLEQIAESYDRVWQELRSLRAKASRLQREVDVLKEAPRAAADAQRELEDYRLLERQLRDALVLGERAASEARTRAREDAEAMLKKARARARELLAAAERDRKRLVAEIERLHELEVRARRDARESLRELASRLESIASADEHADRESSGRPLPLLLSDLKRQEQLTQSGGPPTPSA